MLFLREFYLDNSATTRVCDRAAKEMLRVMQEDYGNPSSLHKKGFEAEETLKEARRRVATVLKAAPEEIYFTSGGTEADNMAIFGAVKSRERFGKKIVTTGAEHPAVLRPMEALEKQGFQVVFLKPDRTGKISPQAVEDAVDENTILVSMMAVNNETGAVFPVEAAADAIERAGGRAFLHVDAVQAFGKIPLSVKTLRADMISISAHKIHGPKGIGALYVRKGVHIPPLLLGGGQEKGMRSGTEAMPSIAGFGAAAAEVENPLNFLPQMEMLRDLCKKGLSQFKGLVWQSPDDAIPYIVNFSIPGIRSEILLHFLSGKGIYVSSGSACAGGAKSHVLQAMGLPREQVDASIRVSFSRYTQQEDIEALVAAVEEGAATLIRQGSRKGVVRK